MATWAITPSSRQRVPVARRQLLAEPAKLVVAVLAVGAAVALVLLLSGLRRGISPRLPEMYPRRTRVLHEQATRLHLSLPAMATSAQWRYSGSPPRRSASPSSAFLAGCT